MPRLHNLDPTERAIKELALKKRLVDARTCVSRSRELIKGSRTLLDAYHSRRKQEKHGLP